MKISEFINELQGERFKELFGKLYGTQEHIIEKQRLRYYKK